VNANPDDEELLRSAVELATANVDVGGGPFGAIVARNGIVLANGVNRVTSTLDPTAHAEVVAIRDACQQVGDFALVGATLYASCEPCPMCLATAMWARIDRVVYAATRDDAAAAGFDDRRFYEEFEGARTFDIVQRRLDEAGAPFDRWRAKADRIEY
jgi:tRNA(Arg) A34 adenosine deaminase TadA